MPSRNPMANIRQLNASDAQSSTTVDAIDRQIIAELGRDGRLSNVELAERVGLSPAPCLRRVRQLESDGVILGYVARINPEAVGRGFEVLVNVDLTRKDRATFEAFEDAVAALEEVVEVRRMFGLPDYCCASRPTASRATRRSSRPSSATSRGWTSSIRTSR